MNISADIEPKSIWTAVIIMLYKYVIYKNAAAAAVLYVRLGG